MTPGPKSDATAMRFRDLLQPYAPESNAPLPPDDEALHQLQNVLRSLAAVTGVSLDRVLERLDSGPPVSSRRIALLRLTAALS